MTDISKAKGRHVMKSFLIRGAAAVGGLVLSLAAATGVASADPGVSSIVNTGCTYDQVLSAANAQGPLAAAFMSSPQQQAGLREFIDSPRPQRQQIAEQIQSNPGNQAYLGLIQQVFNTCSNF
jgi:hemophore-related protein